MIKYLRKKRCNKYTKKQFKNALGDLLPAKMIPEIIKLSKEEEPLIGLGVFFELLWNNSDDTKKDYILQTLKKGL